MTSGDVTGIKPIFNPSLLLKLDLVKQFIITLIHATIHS